MSLRISPLANRPRASHIFKWCQLNSQSNFVYPTNRLKWRRASSIEAACGFSNRLFGEPPIAMQAILVQRIGGRARIANTESYYKSVAKIRNSFDLVFWIVVLKLGCCNRIFRKIKVQYFEVLLIQHLRKQVNLKNEVLVLNAVDCNTISVGITTL